MSEENQTVDPRTELATLKSRADQMGISYHPNIGVEKLRAKINEELGIAEKSADPEPVEQEPIPDAVKEAAEKLKDIHIPSFSEVPAGEMKQPRKRNPRTPAEHRREAQRLVRIRVQCLNPAKKEWPGEVYTVSNKVVGTIKKYVPFNSEEGYHVPKIIYDHLRERKCQVFYNEKTTRGNTIRKGKLINELAIEVLPDLTPDELHNLAQRQVMAKGNNN